MTLTMITMQIETLLSTVFLLRLAMSNPRSGEDVVLLESLVIIVLLSLLSAFPHANFSASNIVLHQKNHYRRPGLMMKIIWVAMVCTNQTLNKSISLVSHIASYSLGLVIRSGLNILEIFHCQRLQINARKMTLRAWHGTLCLDYDLDIANLVQGESKQFYNTRMEIKVHSYYSLIKYIIFHIIFIKHIFICICTIYCKYLVFFTNVCLHRICHQLTLHNRGTLHLCKYIWKRTRYIIIIIILVRMMCYSVMNQYTIGYRKLDLFSNTGSGEWLLSFNPPQVTLDHEPNNNSTGRVLRQWYGGYLGLRQKGRYCARYKCAVYLRYAKHKNNTNSRLQKWLIGVRNKHYYFQWFVC